MKTAPVLALLFLAAASGAMADAKSPDAHRHTGPMLADAARTAAYQASGVVRKSDAAQATATIAHEPIAALGWPAMTMTFKVKDNAVLARLKPGKSVRFAFVKEGGNYVVIDAK